MFPPACRRGRRKLVPGAVDPWAPDVSFFAGRWHVYYAVSTFGAKRSAIGVATSPTLDPARCRYGWTDEGVVVTSSDTTDYNAIDPNVFIDGAGTPWLDFGSFCGGIKLVRLDRDDRASRRAACCSRSRRASSRHGASRRRS